MDAPLETAHDFGTVQLQPEVITASPAHHVDESRILASRPACACARAARSLGDFVLRSYVLMLINFLELGAPRVSPAFV